MDRIKVRKPKIGDLSVFNRHGEWWIMKFTNNSIEGLIWEKLGPSFQDEGDAWDECGKLRLNSNSNRDKNE